jgi:hypothetical protein
MKGKYTRYDLIGAINQFCINNDLHITYVEKKTKSQLEELKKLHFDESCSIVIFKSGGAYFCIIKHCQ